MGDNVEALCLVKECRELQRALGFLLRNCWRLVIMEFPSDGSRKSRLGVTAGKLWWSGQSTFASKDHTRSWMGGDRFGMQLSVGECDQLRNYLWRPFVTLARMTCTNSKYQALFSDFSNGPGNEALSVMTSLCPRLHTSDTAFPNRRRKQIEIGGGGL